MNLKQKPIKSQKLRDSANGQTCTLQIPGICCHDNETSVLCHVPDDSGTGKMGGKSDDHCAVIGCTACHSIIDNLNNFLKAGFTMEDYWWFIHRAMVRTWRYWIQTGLVKI